MPANPVLVWASMKRIGALRCIYKSTSSINHSLPPSSEELARHPNQTSKVVFLYVVTHGQDVSPEKAWKRTPPLVEGLHQKLKTRLGECIEHIHAQGYKLITDNRQPPTKLRNKI